MKDTSFKTIYTSMLIWIGWVVVRRDVRRKCLIGLLPFRLNPLLLIAMMPVFVAYALGPGWVSAYYSLAGREGRMRTGFGCTIAARGSSWWCMAALR